MDDELTGREGFQQRGYALSRLNGSEMLYGTVILTVAFGILGSVTAPKYTPQPIGNTPKEVVVKFGDYPAVTCSVRFGYKTDSTGAIRITSPDTAVITNGQKDCALDNQQSGLEKKLK